MGIIFRRWSRLTVNICFVISRNNKTKSVFTLFYHGTSSMTQQYRIHIDPPNIDVGPKSWCKMHGVTKFTSCSLENMDHMMPCSPGTWGFTDKTGQHYLLLHITWCMLDQPRSCNSDRDIMKHHFWLSCVKHTPWWLWFMFVWTRYIDNTLNDRVLSSCIVSFW